MVPFISIFIVNYNTGGLLEQCLNSIFDNKGDLAVEVFVADNNSTDGSTEMVRAKFPQVSLTMYRQNVGYTKAINPLLPLAKGEYCLLLHPDLELRPYTLDRFLEFFKSHPHAGIVGGNLYYSDGTPNPCEVLWPGFKNDLLCFAFRLLRKLPGGSKVTGSRSPIEWSHQSTCQVNWVWNACMMVRREVFERVGCFDDNFFVWYADWDLCKRAADAGWSVHYVHPAIAIHHERHSFANEDIISDEIRYKVDGWHSAARQIEDRYTFLKKHASPASIYGVKTFYLTENVVRLWLIMGRLLLRKTGLNRATFQLKACLQTIQAILKA